MIPIFVYGTLMPGQSRWGYIQKYVHSMEKGIIEGELFDLGSFPALSLEPNTDFVAYGYLLKTTEDILDILDNIEGFRVPNDPDNLYERTIVDVTLVDDSRIDQAWVYHMIPETLNKFESSVIISGSWENR